MRVCLALLIVAACGQAHGQWQLDGEASSLSFVTVKASHVGEVHHFRKLSGDVDADGVVNVDIDLASVDTLIPIRDERMRKVLFEVANFPNARFSAALPFAELLALPEASVTSRAIAGSLQLKSKTLPLNLSVVISRLSANKVHVASAAPFVMDAAVAGLSEGVEALRELAGLPEISRAVPVSFALVFKQVAPIKVTSAQVRGLLPGQDKTAGYMQLENPTEEVIRLLGARSHQVGAIELHTVKRDGDMLRMRRLNEVTLNPGQTLTFQTGGHHLMLFRVQALEDLVIELITDRGVLDVPFELVSTVPAS